MNSVQLGRYILVDSPSNIAKRKPGIMGGVITGSGLGGARMRRRKVAANCVWQ